MSTGTREKLGARNKLRRPGNKNRKPTAWQRSLTFANIGAAALRSFRAKRAHLPRCGAHCKSTGEPCRQLALENGRCHWHGGATPKGSEWGKRQVRAKSPSRQGPSDWRKTEAKLKKRAEQDKDRIRRLRLMGDEEFGRYVARMGRRLHDRFAPAFTQAVQQEKARRGYGTARLAPPEDPEITPEIRAIHDRIDELKRELAERQVTSVFD